MMLNPIFQMTHRLPVPVLLTSPLVPLRGCVALLGLREDAILELIDDGALEWAWDFRSPTARRSFVVVLADSLRAFQQRVVKHPTYFNDL